MRPQSIVNFERLYLLAIVIGVITGVVTHDKSVADMAKMHINPSAVTWIQVIFTVIGLLLLYFIARRASVVAKWILTVLYLLGLLGFLVAIPKLMEGGTLPAILQVATIALEGVAIYFLFRPDARAWFADGRG
jgi:hypothetical protein